MESKLWPERQSHHRDLGTVAWRCYSFGELSTEMLYAVLRLRQEVFVVEQRCAYLDCDGLDQRSLHLVGYPARGDSVSPLAYLRLIPPQQPAEAVVLGRLLCRQDIRGHGLGSSLLGCALQLCEQLYPDVAVRISAQQYLHHWYLGFGFQPFTAPYEEDGIPHLGMIRQPRQAA